MGRERDVETMLDDLGSVRGITLPVGRKQKRLLGRHISNADTENPLTIFVGSCPDYSHHEGVYTHESLGDGTPLLSRLHLERDVRLLEVLHEHAVPFTFTMMVADVEAEDRIFCDRFTQGSRKEFLARCERSVENTETEIRNLNVDSAIQGSMRSSSFYMEFGREYFVNLQGKYQGVLLDMYQEDGKFKGKVASDVVARRNLYRRMYGDLLREMDSWEVQPFLEQRTIRTMAQYLTLGRLISERHEHAVIINHPTRNITMYNQRNKYRLEGDVVGQQLPIPIFRMDKEVY